MSRPAASVRRAVSLAIPSTGMPGRVLAVLRPPDDPDLPDVWGLPAGRVRAGENVEAAARRTALEKLGVELEEVVVLRSGGRSRPTYHLEMDLVRARIASGEPVVPQPLPGVTQYAEWRWADPEILRPALQEGSLCCRLFFESRASSPSSRSR